MKSKLLILTLTFILSILFISCDNSSQGSFSINLMLPSIPTEVSETDDFGLVAGDEITTLPAVNVKENEDSFVIEVVAPGFKKDNFNVSIDKGVLTISATEEEKKEETKENYTKREFNYTSFTRSFRLPDNIIDESTIKGNYKDGILEVFLGKREEVKPKPARMIEVK